mmetsp:Transcript_26169/g.57112  ORF Transcript_26169/g.57112 Transcript_26169/m.57112 type:complete len:213 (+) Transcript_26169:4955-5593(+)
MFSWAVHTESFKAAANSTGYNPMLTGASFWTSALVIWSTCSKKAVCRSKCFRFAAELIDKSNCRTPLGSFPSCVLSTSSTLSCCSRYSSRSKSTAGSFSSAPRSEEVSFPISSPANRFPQKNPNQILDPHAKSIDSQRRKKKKRMQTLGTIVNKSGRPRDRAASSKRAWQWQQDYLYAALTSPTTARHSIYHSYIRGGVLNKFRHRVNLNDT